MAILYVKHKEPQNFNYTGKWTLRNNDFFFYIIEDGVRVYVQPLDKTGERAFIIRLTVENEGCTGTYSKSENAIVYQLPLEQNGLVVVKVPEEVITNLTIIKFEENKQ